MHFQSHSSILIDQTLFDVRLDLTDRKAAIADGAIHSSAKKHEVEYTFRPETVALWEERTDRDEEGKTLQSFPLSAIVCLGNALSGVSVQPAATISGEEMWAQTLLSLLVSNPLHRTNTVLELIP